MTKLNSSFTSHNSSLDCFVSGDRDFSVSGEQRDVEHAQAIATHESPRTNKLYDRTNDAVSLDEISELIFEIIEFILI